MDLAPILLNIRTYPQSLPQLLRIIIIIKHFIIDMSHRLTLLQDNEIDDSLRRRSAIPNNSGYLDEEYETTPAFPNIAEHHFRIQDDWEILELEKLRKESQPMDIQHIFGSTNQAFKTKMDSLLNGLNSSQTQFANAYPQQTHGFYTLADNYDDNSALQSVLQSANIEAIRSKIDSLTLKDQPPCFIRRKPKRMLDECTPELRELNKKFNKITFDMEDL